MQQLFWKIYGAILFCILGVLTTSYFTYEAANNYRYKLHLQEIMQGTNHLLSVGVDRQPTENKKKWLSLSSSLMDIPIYIKLYSDIDPDLKVEIREIKSQPTDDVKFALYHYLKSSNSWLMMELDEYSEQIAKATAFLLLNELGSTASSKRQEKFDTLVEIFSYPIYRSAQQNLNLDIQQIEALKRGETVVEWTKQFGRTTAMNVYAPWGKTNDILVLDGIKMFDPYPVNIIASFIIISLLLIATSIMFIVGNLTRQLHSLQEKVDAISPEDNKQKSTIVSTNAINQLNEKIFAMANRIEKLLNEKAYMIRAVSHDLRTPIAKIHFRLEALTMIVGEDNTALQGCKDDLKQLNVLIDELLTYEKLVQTPTVNFSDIQLSKLIKKQIDSSLILHPEIAINILDSTNGEFYIEGHKGLLLRLFDNILNNASRYAKSKIRVSIEQESQQLSITIDDDGTGLDKNTIDHLFEPFFRTDSSRNSELGGYGMGLAIVKQIAKQHNVKITVANNEWYGASFVLHFPIKTTNIQMKRK